MLNAYHGQLSSLIAETVQDKGRASDRIYDVLKIAIRDLILKPNEQLIDTEIAQHFSVSKEPTRVAFARLEADGLVEIRSKRGTYVRPIKLEEVIEAMKIREALEIIACKAAANRVDTRNKIALEQNIVAQRSAAESNDPIRFHELDEEFHQLLVVMSGFLKVPQILSATRTVVSRVRKLSAPIPGRLEILLGQHENIMRGVTASDSGAAAAAMELHMHDVYPHIELIYVQYPEAFDPPA